MNCVPQDAVSMFGPLKHFC